MGDARGAARPAPTATERRLDRTGGSPRPGLLALLALLPLVLLLATPELRAQARGQDAVASESGLAAKEAMAVLRAGGNAVDAAITATLVAGVASPTSSGIGGGGFVLVWDAQSGKPTLLDFRETAPAAIDAAAFERRPLPWAERGKLTGVPGEVAGLWELHKRFGKKPWADLVAPAVRAASSGFSVEKHLAGMLAFGQKDLTRDANLAAVFYPDGKPTALGKLVKNPKLAATLEAVQKQGPKALSEGPIARDIVDTVQRAGGALSLKDLQSYKVLERTPLEAVWEGHTVYSMPPPSAGGLMLLETLALFSKAELAQLGRRHGTESGAYVHMLAESLRAAIADRMRHLGDPDYVQVDVAALTSPQRMAARKRKLGLYRTHNLPRFGLEEHGTHHLVTADAAGNVVSLTTTVNRLFGAKLTAEASGIVLNDELDDFTAKADVAPFGMSESPNRPRPGARPASSMTPTIVVRGKQPVLAIGGSGGPTIATNTTQLTLAHLVFGQSPAKAVAARRFYVPTSKYYILLEKGAPSALWADLERRGEIVGEMKWNGSAVQMLSIGDRGFKEAAADPRKHGSALVR